MRLARPKPSSPLGPVRRTIEEEFNKLKLCCVVAVDDPFAVPVPVPESATPLLVRLYCAVLAAREDEDMYVEADAPAGEEPGTLLMLALLGSELSRGGPPDPACSVFTPVPLLDLFAAA